MTVKEYAEKLEVTRELFYSEESMFGIYSCKPVHYNKEIINKWGNLSIQGTTRRLAVGDEYEIKFEGAYAHQKYGDYYKIIEVEMESLESREDQDRFLKAVLADNHFKSLKDAYPNTKLVDLILSDAIDVSKTKGIKQKTLAKIKDTVEKNAGVSVLIAKLQGLNLSINKVERILKHFGSPDLAMQAIDENIYNLCNLKNFGFLTIDKVAVERGDNPTNKNRIKACIDFLIKKDLDEGHTWTVKSEILDKAIEMLDIDNNLVEDMMQELSNNKQYYSDENRITFKKVRDKEISLYKHLKRIQDSYVAPVIDDIDYQIHLTERQQGFKFTEEQRNVIVDISTDHGVSIVNGAAGGGKSTVIKGIISALNTDLYMCCTLSGKAANILQKNGLNSSTIHRMLKWEPITNGFQYNENEKLPYEVIIMDELSMNSIDLILSVLKAIPDNCKIVFVGDSGQLSSIGSAAGDVLRDLLETNEFPSYELTKVHRQKGSNSGILEIATSIRNGEQLMPYDSSGREVYGELEDQTLISYPDKIQILPDILQIARAYKSKIKSPEDLLDFQVIVPNRERGELSVRNINNKLQEIFNNLEKPAISRNAYFYRQGDKVISNGNQYGIPVFDDEFKYYDYLNATDRDSVKIRETDVYNGTLGYIFDVNTKEKSMLVQFEGVNGLVEITQQGADSIDLSYAATCHRMQGSGIRDVIAVASYESFMLLSRQLLYTMVTRASGKGLLLVENNAMHTAIKTDAGRRRTFLQEIIRGEQY